MRERLVIKLKKNNKIRIHLNENVYYKSIGFFSRCKTNHFLYRKQGRSSDPHSLPQGGGKAPVAVRQHRVGGEREQALGAQCKKVHGLSNPKYHLKKVNVDSKFIKLCVSSSSVLILHSSYNGLRVHTALLREISI